MHARNSDGHQIVLNLIIYSHIVRDQVKSKSQVSCKVETKPTQTKTQPKTSHFPSGMSFLALIIWLPPRDSTCFASCEHERSRENSCAMSRSTDFNWWRRTDILICPILPKVGKGMRLLISTAIGGRCPSLRLLPLRWSQQIVQILPTDQMMDVKVAWRCITTQYWHAEVDADLSMPSWATLPRPLKPWTWTLLVATWTWQREGGSETSVTKV